MLYWYVSISIHSHNNRVMCHYINILINDYIILLVYWYILVLWYRCTTIPFIIGSDWTRGVYPPRRLRIRVFWRREGYTPVDAASSFRGGYIPLLGCWGTSFLNPRSIMWHARIAHNPSVSNVAWHVPNPTPTQLKPIRRPLPFPARAWTTISKFEPLVLWGGLRPASPPNESAWRPAYLVFGKA